ncbi:hypothetical protein [Streptomyces sp. NPDC003015]
MLLARLDRRSLWEVLCAPHAKGALDRVFFALLDEGEPLGPAGVFLAGLVGRPGGSEAVLGDAVPARYLHRTRRGDRTGIWRAAVDAGLPAAALRGAGHFAFTDVLKEDTWLELTAATIGQQPDLDDAERAARTPHSLAAQLIAATVLDDTSSEGYRRALTIRHAAALFAHAPTESTPEREALRVALINAGAIEDAYRD